MIINEMPKTIPNYSYCKIYKIVSNQTDEIYIGSTCQKYLCNRLGQHKQKYKKYLLGKNSYISSFKILKYDDAKIVLIQAYPECKSKEEQSKYEQVWLDNLDCVNKYRAYTTIEESKRIQKEWCENNKDKIKAYRGVIIKCECGRMVSRGNIPTHRKRPIHFKNLLKTTNCFS